MRYQVPVASFLALTMSCQSVPSRPPQLLARGELELRSDGKLSIWAGGQRVASGLGWSGLADHVRCVPKAFKEAEAAESAGTSGPILSAFGMTFGILSIGSLITAGVVSADHHGSYWPWIGGGVGGAIVGAILAVAGLSDRTAANGHAVDAMNFYNDAVGSLGASCQDPTAVAQPKEPPPMPIELVPTSTQSKPSTPVEGPAVESPVPESPVSGCAPPRPPELLCSKAGATLRISGVILPIRDAKLRPTVMRNQAREAVGRFLDDWHLERVQKLFSGSNEVFGDRLRSFRDGCDSGAIQQEECAHGYRLTQGSPFEYGAMRLPIELPPPACATDTSYEFEVPIPPPEEWLLAPSQHPEVWLSDLGRQRVRELFRLCPIEP